MQISLILLAVAILLLRLTSNKETIKDPIENESASTVLSQVSEETMEPDDGESVSIKIDSNISSDDTIVTIQSDNEFIYPNSDIIKDGENTLVLSSSDSTDTITEWYKEKIKLLGYTAKSTVKTKTNGQVQNQLAAASSKNKVEIKITKSEKDNVSRIEVVFN